MQVEAVDTAERNGFYCALIAPTGLGKAWMLIECLRRINPKGRVWYLCDSENNRDITFKKELKKWGAEKWIDRIEFMCYQSAYKLENEEVELALCDEFDMALTPEYSKAMTANKFKYFVAVSATLEGKKRSFAKEIAPIVYEKHLKEIEDAKILNSARHHFVNFLLSKKENEKYLNFNYRFGKLLLNERANRSSLEMLQIQRKHFLSGLSTSRNVCRKLLKELHDDPNSKILVFCGLSSQADEVCKYSYHSKSEVDYLQMFDEGEIRILSVVGKVDRGVNLDGINKIVFESPNKSSTKFTQKSGRGRRLNEDEVLDIYYLVPYYIDRHKKPKPTIVKTWILQATKKVNFEPNVYKFND